MKNTRPPQRRQARSGRSLIELMITLVIGAMILAGVLMVTAGASNSGRKGDSQGRMIEAGQVALQLLSNDVRMAGYSAPQSIFTLGYITKMLFGAGVRGCDNGFTNTSGSGAAANISALTCATTSATPSASFSIVYETDNFNTITVNTSDGTVPSDCRGIGLPALSAGAAGNTLAPDQLAIQSSSSYWLVENRYFVGSTSDGDVALMCSGNGGSGSSDTPFSGSVTLLRGVERMTVRYGVGDGAVNTSRNPALVEVTPDAVQYMTANAIDTNPAWAGEASDVRWQRAVSMRICLEVRGDLNTASTSDGTASFINCDGTTTAITDTRQRRSVTMMMNLRNRTTILNGGTIGQGDV
jgi:type IV pilus assembly protein PilW